MKRIIRYIPLILLIVVIIANIITAVCFCQFMKRGVHSFAGYTKLDFSKKVYFIEANTKIVQGSSTLTVSGIIQPCKSTRFRGLISISEYPPAEGSYEWFSAIRSQGTIIIANQAAPAYPHYRYFGSDDNTDLYAVFITLEDGSSVSAYPGNTEEEALENYDHFWNWFENH